ncbi:hypothetical protein PKF022_03360 [Polynucleobacter sp. KF022]|nr:hypothetical protein PKF022_03360 [Polynucleobacter sp. KF022]
MQINTIKISGPTSFPVQNAYGNEIYSKKNINLPILSSINIGINNTGVIKNNKNTNLIKIL